MITRQLGSILRGKATPFQLVAACVLGAMIGFAPGFLQAPALWTLLVGALLVVNANLGLAGLVGAGAGLLSLVAAPLSFQVGRLLLDGPMSVVARGIVNARVLAWCGMEYYAVAGGQALAIVIGALLGLVIARSVTGFRRRMLAAKDNPTRWRELAQKPGAKLAIWLFFGGTGKQGWEDKLAKKVGNPVRVWGAALMLIVLIGGWLSYGAFAGPLARRGLKVSLEEANGATVDVGPIALDLGQGRFSVADLALADPNELGRDLFRAALLEADVDEADILRRRVHVARLVIKDAKSGEPRAKPGVRVAPKAAEVYEEARRELPDPSDLSIEQVLEEYETWKARLAQTRRWIDRLSGKPSDGGAEGAEGDGRETLAERLAREVRDKGWLRVEAAHLRNEAPTFRLTELSIEGLGLSWMPGRVFDVRGNELSTHPALVDGPPRLEIASRDGAIQLLVDLAPVSRAGGDGALKLVWKGLDVDAVMGMLKLPGPAPMQGGTLDLELDGSWLGGRIGEIDLPLRATFRGTTVAIKGLEPTQIDQLVIPIGLKGPIDSPAIQFDSSRFADALADAGKAELSRRLREGLEEKVGEKLEELGEKAGVELPDDVLKKAKQDPAGVLEGVLGGKKKKKKKNDG